MKSKRVITVGWCVSLWVIFTLTAVADPLGHWSQRSPLLQGNQLYGITYGNGTFVAVGDSTIVTSPDG